MAAILTELARMSTVRLIPPGGSADGVLVDLLFASTGVVLPVARLGHLLAMKLLSVGEGRPNDAQDLLSLLRDADSAELDRCRELCGVITARGFHRGRDRAAGLGEWVGRG